MILEWKEEPMKKPAEAAAEEPAVKHTRSAEAAAWEARQAQTHEQKTGLERPSRPSIPDPPALPGPPALSGQIQPRPHKPSGFERAMHIAHVVAPFVQRVLPLLEGNIATAAASLLLNRPSVDLDPIEKSLDKLKASQLHLTENLAGQGSQLKNLSADLDSLRNAVDESKAGQTDLEQNVTSLRSKVTVLLWMVIALLVISLTANIYLGLHLLHIVP